MTDYIRADCIISDRIAKIQQLINKNAKKLTIDIELMGLCILANRFCIKYTTIDNIVPEMEAYLRSAQ